MSVAADKSATPSSLQGTIKNFRDRRFLRLARTVEQWVALWIEYNHMRYIAPIVLLHYLLLRRRGLPVEVDDYEIDSSFVLLVQVYGAMSLALGVKAAFAEHKHVIRLSKYSALFEAVTGDKRPVM